MDKLSNTDYKIARKLLPRTKDKVCIFFSNRQNKYMFMPLDWFVLSKFIYDMVYNASGEGSFEENTSNEDWLVAKIVEFEEQDPLKGSFWKNIAKLKGINLRDLHSITNMEDLKNRENNYLDLDDVIIRKSLIQGLHTRVKQLKQNEEYKVEDYGILGEIELQETRGTCSNTPTNIKKENNMVNTVKNTVVKEISELVNQSGAADIALGKLLYNNIKSAAGRTVVKISMVDKMVATVSKRMKYKNEVTELIGVLALMVVLKQFYDHKALENVRGYIVNRLYVIGIESTGFDDVIALIGKTESVEV